MRDLSQKWGLPKSTICDALHRLQASQSITGQDYRDQSRPDEGPVGVPGSGSEPNRRSAIRDFRGSDAEENGGAEQAGLGVSGPREYLSQPSNRSFHSGRLVHPPGGDALAVQLTSELHAHVPEVLDQGTHHLLRVSLSVPSEALEDLPARWDLLGRGRPVAEALHGWPPIEALYRVLAAADAIAGSVSLDVSIVGRLHFYGVAIVSRRVSSADLDRRWSEETGAHEGGDLKNRVREPYSWPHVITMHEALATSACVTHGAREALARLLDNLLKDEGQMVSYSLKGGDRSSFKHRMCVTLPKQIHARPAHEWIVWALGLPSAVGLGIQGQAITPAQAQAVREVCIDARLDREHTCARCGEVLAMVRAAGPERRRIVIDSKGREHDVPAPVRVPRVDRMFCSHACAAKSSRAYRRVLALLGRSMRKVREAVLDRVIDEAMAELDREAAGGLTSETISRNEGAHREGMLCDDQAPDDQAHTPGPDSHRAVRSTRPTDR